MKTIPLKVPYIIVSIHKHKSALPALNIFLIPTGINISCKIPINTLTMLESAKEFPLINIAVRVVVCALALH
jgi:hypothetical protein